jgi:hypothetical protein
MLFPDLELWVCRGRFSAGKVKNRRNRLANGV